MDILFVLGRVLFGGFFVINGFNHFASRKSLVEAAAAHHIPLPDVSVVVTGLMMLLGGLAVVFGVYVQIGLWLIIAFLVTAAFTMHQFWRETEPNARLTQMVFFLRNLALTGAALMMMSLPEPWISSL